MSECSGRVTTEESSGDGDKEITQIVVKECIPNEIDEILLDKQFICEAVANTKEAIKNSDLEERNFLASFAILEGTEDILEIVQFLNQCETYEEITLALMTEKAQIDKSLNEICAVLEKLKAVVDNVEERYMMNGRCI